MLPDATSCKQAYAVFHYNLPSALRITFDPKLLFLASPAAEMDFTLVACPSIHSTCSRCKAFFLLRTI